MVQWVRALAPIMATSPDYFQNYINRSNKVIKTKTQT